MSTTHKIFGTDGIRGTIGQGLMSPEHLVKLGWAIGEMLAQTHPNPLVVIGKDTRVSGYMIESALEAGLSYSGTDIYLVGPTPTPGLSFLTQEFAANAGIMISASHNPYEDNGIKLFNHLGEKLCDQQEELLTKLFFQPLQINSKKTIHLGKAKRIDDAMTRYMSHCTTQLPIGKPLKGLKLVLDCANGAAYQVAPMIFNDLGAEVIAIYNQPDGFNINLNCGSTAPEALKKAVQEHQADCGIALDGDADRIIMVDDRGTIRDGDDLLYLLANFLPELNKIGVVGTTMTNMGLESLFKKQNIAFHRTDVGDRYVAKELVTRGWALGGEPSGHIICAKHSKTGDGILTGALVMNIMAKQQTALSSLLSPLMKWPQQHCNISKPREMIWTISEALQSLLNLWQQKLGENGRIVLRESGTESCIRLMVEAKDHGVTKQALLEISKQIQLEIANPVMQ